MDYHQFLADWHSDSPTLLVHTSGSTGQPKPLLVEKRRMEASARTTCRFLGLQPGDTALLCMSTDYIAGMMMVVRALVGDLSLVVVEPCGHPLQGLAEAPCFAAMVPLQVYNSLQVPRERELLMATRHLIIGGGAIDPGLERELRSFPHAVWSTYGMTETLSHIALRRLSGAGASTWYTPLDGVTVGLSADGCLVVDAPEVCATQLVTHDIAEIGPDGRSFRIIGRQDNVICTGGIKLHIEQLETRLRPHIGVPFVVTKVSDRKFGEAVVLLVADDGVADMAAVCRRHLSRYEQPRHIIRVGHIPLTATGKPARAEAQQLACRLLGTAADSAIGHQP